MPVDVADWLSGLGLGHYAPAFAANDIDGEVLRELTADDLIGLGVTSIGHRRKLLAAIAALRSEAPQPVAGTAPTPTASIEAERRQATSLRRAAGDREVQRSPPAACGDDRSR